MAEFIDKLHDVWQTLYGSQDHDILAAFVQEIQAIKRDHFVEVDEGDTTWYKDEVVYSTYADLFNRDLPGLRDKLGYLQELGITCLWLLPILKSPMKDAGFDISDFDAIRASLLGVSSEASPKEKDRIFTERYLRRPPREVR